MPERSLDDLRHHLRCWATELSSRVAEPPVMLRDICNSLGVEIAKKHDVPRFKAYLSIDPSRDHPAKILLPPKWIGNFERFCIAHELAHYLLFVAFSITPRNESEYWQHEELCDDFARYLLIPAQFFSEKPIDETAGADAYLSLCSNISGRARVPWIQVAHRITEFRCDVIYLRCERLSSNDFKFMATTHPRRKGRGKVVKQQTELWSGLDTLLRHSIKVKSPVRSDLTNEFSRSKMSAALGFSQEVAVVAEAQSTDIRIVARAVAA